MMVKELLTLVILLIIIDTVPQGIAHTIEIIN